MRFIPGCLVIVLVLALHAPAQEKHDGHADEVKLSADAIQRHGIKVEPLTRRVLTPTFATPARVAFNAEAMAHVGSTLRGRVVQINAKTGDEVNKGEELFIIESPELAEWQSDFLLKRTEAEVAAIAVEPSRMAYERARSLHEKNEGISLAEVQRRELEWRAAQGKLTAARGAAVAAENRLHILGMDQAAVEKLAQTGEITPRSVVRAPISGQVVERHLTLGELVNPDRDALLVLADMTTLWVLADVPEARLAEITTGSAARVRLAAGGAQPIEGKVMQIAPALDPETRTASARIEVPGGGAIRPGMFAHVELISSRPHSTEPVLALPEEAVLNVEGRPGVFVPVAGEENTFALRQVRAGKPIGGMVHITEGLAEGDAVVVGGAFILKADLGKGGAAHEH